MLISGQNNLIFRPLEKEDTYSVCLLLEQLSEFPGGVDAIDIEESWNKLAACSNAYAVVGISDDKIVCYGSVIIEYKIRGGRSGHIEDIVVDQQYRRKGYGDLLITHLTDYCKAAGCYKVILDCYQETVPFYNKLHFNATHFGMSRYL
ncbi:GNAT family N-acetyltransferase [Dyadobacter sp. BHUBP1]|uniref:GNAT family N-acetyltransferase n=1 Tax=Dyadobacter sp. BHUBP1 TaxID=3424178 RepID=UPI003D32B6EF